MVNSPAIEKENKENKEAEREISAGVIIYRLTEEGPKFLIVYHRHGYWNFPKGKIENEERSWEAAVREIWEETGLKLRDLKFKKNFKAYERFAFTKQGKKIQKTVIFYLAETSQRNVRLLGDHEEGYGWFLFREAQKILGKYKDSQRILIQARNFIRRLKSPQKTTV